MNLIIYILSAVTLSHASVDLGRELFFDRRLSGNNKMSCSSCHQPELGWSDGRPTAIGNNGVPLLRRTPSIAYLENASVFFWDGRASSLEQQALTPIISPLEMNQKMDELIDELYQIPNYVELFNKYYPQEGITENTILKSIASFERSINVRNSAFDRYRSGVSYAISEDAKKGFTIFSSLRANCLFCHKGIDFNDQKLWDVGVSGTDSGRNGQHLFKTPSLRDISRRAPYFHNGSVATLDGVVRFYMRGGDVKRPGQANQQRPKIILSEQEIYQLVEFLKTL